MLKNLCVVIALFAVPAVAFGEEESQDRNLENDLLECADFRGLKRYFCLDEVLHALDSAPESLKGRSEKFFKTPGDWIGSARISGAGSKDVQLPYLLLFDKNIPGGRSSNWPFQPAHAFVVSCRETGYEVSLFLQGLQLVTIAGGNIVQFKIDDNPTVTLYLNATMNNRFFGRMSASGQGVEELVEALEGGDEMKVWVTVRPEDEVSLAFRVSRATENLDVIKSSCSDE